MTDAIVHLSAKQPEKTFLSAKRQAWDWLGAAFFLTAITFAGFRLAATQWTGSLLGEAALAVLAGVFGLLIGRSQLPRWLAYIYGFFYGTFFIPLFLSFTFATSAGTDERLRILAQKIFRSFGQLSEGAGATEPVLFLLFLAIIIWSFGFYSGFRFSRDQNAWAALLPFGFFILVVQTYDPLVPGRVWFVALYVACALLLIQRLRLLAQEARWKKERFHEPQATSGSLQLLAFEVALSSILIAWFIPSLPASLDEAEQIWKRITSPVQEFERNVERALDPLQGPVAGGDLFGSTLGLGRGSTHGDALVFSVEPLSTEPDVRHYYWRDRVYDHYEDGKWTSTFTESQELNKGQSVNWALGVEGRIDLVFQITVERAT
ncbi:MAG TPA: transglutaminaseTgpA domain-containing protein, partial [Terriglobales bacterium]|nr:transglutaminaseTgpA domain-containing protein [Terriglobales bacterium]